MPKSIIDKAVKYLADCTTDRGGVIYSVSSGRAVSGPNARDHGRRLLLVQRRRLHRPERQEVDPVLPAVDPDRQVRRDSFGHWEYTHYYYAQVIYCLGEDSTLLFPKSKESEQLRWSSYRKVIFEFLREKQGSDGTWNISYIGPVFNRDRADDHAADNGTLPIHQR